MQDETELPLGPLGIRQEKQTGDRVSKAQKRRDKKADKEKDRAADIERQEEENKLGARHLEQEAIKARLTTLGLTLKEVSSWRPRRVLCCHGQEISSIFLGPTS